MRTFFVRLFLPSTMKKYRQSILAFTQKYRNTTQPICYHFGKCGGCLFQDISYENQLALKLEYLNHLFNGIATIKEIVPSIPYNYRNRMDFVTAFGKIGLRKAKNFKEVIDITECALLQNKSSMIFKKIRNVLSEVPYYDYIHHTGYLRYVVIREAFYTGNLMVNFVVAHRDDRISNYIQFLINEIDSISILFNDSLADTSFGKEFVTLKQGFITERFDNIQYIITPNSFFQSNSSVALQLYNWVKKHIHGESVLDLFCGSGTISLFIAQEARHVTGVEIVQEAIDSAGKNKALNLINNVDFICADARTFYEKHGKEYSTVILDPPRGGVHPKLIHSIAKYSPKKIIYISCNPPLFRHDLQILENYSLESLIAFDMFPQTPHLETAALLLRK